MRIKSLFYQIERLVIVLLALSLPVGCINGCGQAGLRTGNVEKNVSESSGGYYKIEEFLLPDPEVSLMGEATENSFFGIVDYLEGEKICRIVRRTEYDSERENLLAENLYLQSMEAPYAQWETYRIIPEDWAINTDGESVPDRLGRFISGSSDDIFCEMFCGRDEISLETADDARFIGSCSADGKCTVLGRLPEELEGASYFRAGNGSVYAFSMSDGVVCALDESLRVRESYPVNGIPCGIRENPENGDIFVYGIDEKAGVGVWELNGKRILPEEFREISGITPDGFCFAVSASGLFYLADNTGIWCFRAGEMPEKILSFYDKDYFLSDVNGMSVLEGEIILMRVTIDDAQYLLRVQESEEVPDEKQEIVLALAYEDPIVNEMIARFNRQNGQWKVVCRLPEQGESVGDYITRLQLEISSGKGPDLLQGVFYPQDVPGIVRNDGLEQLDDLLEEEQDVYWQALFDSCRVDEKLYGIPLEGSLEFPTFHRDFVGERTAWTLEEMIGMVRESNAKILQWETSGDMIVFYYGLMDNENKALIDWENGESHLTEKPFLDLLAFAKEYADQGQVPAEELKDALEEGTVSAMGAEFGTFCFRNARDLNRREAYFSGKESYIGFPCSTGDGIYAQSDKILYLNSNSNRKEGAREFLRYVISEEAQMRFAEKKEHYYGIPVRWDAIRYRLKLQTKDTDADTVMESTTGVSYGMNYVTEENAEEFLSLVERAKPGNWYAIEILFMSYDELEPYFAGQRSVEDTARILDNRVQLYLNEHKR